MKIVITENQYNLLLEQPNVYTNEVSYKNALKTYEEVLKIYNDSVKYYNFVKSLPMFIEGRIDETKEDPFLDLFINKTKKRTADSLIKDAKLYKKNGLEVEFWYGKNWDQAEGGILLSKIEKGSSNGTYEDIKKILPNLRGIYGQILQEYRVNKIYIIANDHDYLQLLDDNTEIVNFQNKFLKEAKKVFSEPQKNLFYKIVLGDKSDNIMPIFKKCGPKTCEKYYENNDLFLEALKKENAYEKYELNKKLVDFRELPLELVSGFTKENSELLEKL